MQIKAEQLWKRVKGTRKGTIVRVVYVSEFGIEWRAVIGGAKGSLLRNDFLSRYVCVSDTDKEA